VDEPKNVTLRVIEQGAVRVNAAHLHREAQGIVCIYVDLHSKYVEPPVVGGCDSEPPVLYFTAGEDALHLDDSKPRDSLTIVEFPEYVGWHVFACYGPARYTLSVVLVAARSMKTQRNDAERYRYLRNRLPADVLGQVKSAAGCWIDCEDESGTLVLLTGDDADFAVDAAMDAALRKDEDGTD